MINHTYSTPVGSLCVTTELRVYECKGVKLKVMSLSPYIV